MSNQALTWVLFVLTICCIALSFLPGVFGGHFAGAAAGFAIANLLLPAERQYA